MIALAPLLAMLAAAPEGEERSPVRPTMVRLDFEGRTLAEIAAELTRRGPFAVAVPPDDPASPRVFQADPARPAPPPERFRVVEAEPLPFWSAMDRLGRATGRRAEVDESEGPVRILLRRSLPGRGFATVDGPCRVRLDAIDFKRSVTFALPFYPTPGLERLHGATPPGIASAFVASMTLVVEPRSWIERVGDVTLIEATDDRGRSLIPARPAPRTEPLPPFGAPSRCMAAFAVALRYPDEPGATIQRLRGTVAVRLAGLPAPGPPEREVTVGFDFADVPMP